MKTLYSWTPAVIFALGSVLLLGVDRQQHMELEGDLARDLPTRLYGLESTDLVVSAEEQRIAGMDDYLLRSYGTGVGTGGNAMAGVDAPAATPGGTAPAVSGFTLYVGFYGSQAQGRTIHSPKNCLPGSGWEALHSRRTTVATAAGPVPVNRYLLQRDDEQALVLYWYQGRGRIRANEYLVKLDLLRDSALRNRSDEALVRIVVPIETSEEVAFEAASRIAAEIIPAVDEVLPAG